MQPQPQAAPPARPGARPKTVVVMPAYNAAKTLAYTYETLPPGCVDEVILVDDGSHDDTFAVAQALGLITIRHPRNAGYGANQKTCYAQALAREAEIVIMLHPDGQYNPAVVPEMAGIIAAGAADVVLGSRLLTPGGALRGGMPLYKYLSNRCLTAVENLVLGQHLSEYHTGYRAFHRRVLERVPYLRNSDDFVFDQQILFQIVACNFRILEIPVATRYFLEASTISFASGVRYGLETLGLALRYLGHRAGWRSQLFLP